MNNSPIKFPVCPPNMVEVASVQTVAGMKALNNTFVYVTDINTTFFIDNQHRITWISGGVVEAESYDLLTNPLNLRNQFLYDPSTKELHYFSNTGYAATFTAVVTQEDIDSLEEKISANTTSINGLTAELGQTNTALANETTAREQADTQLQTTLNTEVTKLTDSLSNLQTEVEEIEVPTLPSAMVYDFVSPAGTNNPSTADIAKVTVRVVQPKTGDTSSSALMLPSASTTQAGTMTAADKSKLDAIPDSLQQTIEDMQSRIAALEAK